MSIARVEDLTTVVGWPKRQRDLLDGTRSGITTRYRRTCRGAGGVVAAGIVTPSRQVADPLIVVVLEWREVGALDRGTPTGTGMRRLGAQTLIYLHIAGIWPQITYIYRFNLAVEVAGVLLQVFLLKTVWTALYAQHSTIAGLSLSALIADLTLSNLQLWLMHPFIASEIRRRVYEGTVAHDLTRPVAFPAQMLAQQFGMTAGVIPFVVLALPFAIVVGGMQLPNSVGAALAYAISLLLAYLVTILLGLLIGLVSFWTIELGGLLGIYLFASQFFSGAMVPLRFFPPPLHVVAMLLPFQTQAALPMSIYLGQVQGAAVAQTLGFQALWVLLLSTFAWLFWRRAFRRVVVQGG